MALAFNPMRALDPQIWKLCVGLTLAFGCTPSDGVPIDGEGDTSTSTTVTTTTTTSSSGSETPPECESAEDCGDDADCIDNMCVNNMPDDTGPGDECNDDADCPPGTYCDFGSCVDPPAAISPPCEPLAVDLIPLTTSTGPVLALSFVDIDDDGTDELAVATETHIELFDGTGETSTSSPREPWASVQAMVAGHFDDQPGEDLTLLFNGSLWRANLIAPASFSYTTALLVWLGDISGVRAGQYMNDATTELLVWGMYTGVRLEGAGTSAILYDGSIQAVTALELGTPTPGLLVVNGYVYRHLQFDGTLVDDGSLINSSAHPLGDYTAQGQTGYFGLSTSVLDWQQVVTWDPAALPAHEQQVWVPTATQADAADLDGDGHDELLFRGPGFGILYGLRTDAHCYLEPSFTGIAAAVSSFAIGDWDGDGDDDLALRFADGQAGIWPS